MMTREKMIGTMRAMVKWDKVSPQAMMEMAKLPKAQVLQMGFRPSDIRTDIENYFRFSNDKDWKIQMQEGRNNFDEIVSASCEKDGYSISFKTDENTNSQVLTTKER